MAGKRGARSSSAVAERGEEAISHSLSYESILNAQGVYRRAGQLFRTVDVPTGSETDEDGSVYALYIEQVERPVSMDLAEARIQGHDYYDPAIGWIRGGMKREREDPKNVGSATAGMHKIKRVPIGGPATRQAKRPVQAPAPAPVAPDEEGQNSDGL